MLMCVSVVREPSAPERDRDGKLSYPILSLRRFHSTWDEFVTPIIRSPSSISLSVQPVAAECGHHIF